MRALVLQVAGLLAVAAGGFLISPGAGIVALGVDAVYVGLALETN